MSSRKPPKIDPRLNLSDWLLPVDKLPKSLTSTDLFDNDRPLEIEVGCGKGLFLERVTGENPNRNFLGIEIASKYAAAAAARLARSERPNGKVISGNAEPLFQERIPAASLAAVHVYFPDPWWKSKHKRRRVLNERFLRNVSQCLAPGGTFHFWTDVLDYFESTLEQMARVVPELGPPIPEKASKAQHDLDYRTHFERRSCQNAIPVYRVRFQITDS